jgi:hypothetical protein
MRAEQKEDTATPSPSDGESELELGKKNVDGLAGNCRLVRMTAREPM